MQIVVSGLWHLGCVTAASLAEHYRVIGHDPDPTVVAGLERDEPPLFEPGMTELLSEGRRRGKLTFTSDSACVASADIVWITHDTPVDADDRADVDFVANAIEALFGAMRPGTLVVISSQIPAGFIARMERSAAAIGLDLTFAYAPENLRLGQALTIFRHPDRVIVGVRTAKDRDRMASLLSPFTDNVVWMSPESAEMTKHALNAFLATSVTFMNEIAAICETVGADVKDVERGLKSESRIGPRAYLTAGDGFAGGTLARDVHVLTALATQASAPRNVLQGVVETNALQRRWSERALLRALGTLRDKRIAFLGLTYKPGTNTLRRSTAVELCRRLHDGGANISAYDPSIAALPPDLAHIIELAADADAALRAADAVVVGTEWPEFRDLSPDTLHQMTTRVVVDPKRWLEATFASVPDLQYFGVGRGALTTPDNGR